MTSFTMTPRQWENAWTPTKAETRNSGSICSHRVSILIDNLTGVLCRVNSTPFIYLAETVCPPE